VTEPTGDGITYSWSLNDVHVEGASGSEYPFDLMVGQDIKISVAITAEGCDALPGSVTVKGGANCGSQVCLEVVNETGEVVHETCADDNPQCLEAGKYIVRVVEPEGDNLAYSWSLNDELVGEPYGPEYPLDLMAGQDVKIGVAITANCCPALPGSVTLKGEHVCPETLELALTDSQGEPVETADCLPIGDYTLTVVTPEADALDLIWYVNGAPYPNQTNTSLTYSLGEGETVIISVEAVNCCDRRPYGQQLLEACDCPEDNLGITVMRDGVPIPPGGCVDPGFFTAQVSGDLGNATLNWTQDGNLLGNGNTVGFTFDQTWGDDCNGPPSTTITVTAASDDPNCPPQSVSTTLTTCGQFTLEKCVPCWLLKLGILLSAGIFAIALAIFLCPVVVSTVVSPIPIPAWEPVAVIIVSAAPWVALAAAAVGVILWGIWRSMCQPDLCGGWLVLIWQLLVGIGVVFIYFGLCPACLYLLIPGFGLFLSGIGVFIYWIIICRPSMCKIFFEIGNLALVQLVVGWLQIILGACIWTYGPFLMAIWQTALFAVGWIGFIWACFAAPPQN
ncbi:MAG: hypothetical protein KC419_23030, partial [Anaerolineales bacterium]|nr:hypothetical protein [Anaerolineales bacterium]